MKVRHRTAKALALLGAGATLGLTQGGCEHRNPDIDRVQPNYVRKAIFQTDEDWYFRRTIVESEVANTVIVEGSGDIFLEKVRFDVQEDWLLAYKPYENTPGAQVESGPDGQFSAFFKGAVVAAWPIERHFDILRDYDAITGNVTNVIDENTTDRPWHARSYMRVDFSSNAIEGKLWADFAIGWFPVNLVSTGSFWTSLDSSPTDYHASRFSDDYVEINDRALLGMDVLQCFFLQGGNNLALGGCGFGEAKVRYAFMKADPNNDYVPRDYPDSYVRRDENGNPVHDEETGEVSREPIVDRFGFFRVSTPTYDRGHGRTETGRLFRATLFNIWERHTDDQGAVLPYRARTPKPIIYYTNAEYPERYRVVAEESAADYDRVFTDLVTDLTGAAPGFPMFEIRRNSCNEENIIRFVTEAGAGDERVAAVARAVCVDGTACSVNAQNLAEHIGIGNLKTVCTSLEAVTMNPETGVSAFPWQRIGDPRHNMVVWYARPQDSGWSGYGPMHADPQSGQTIAATSFLRGHYLEAAAANIVDYIELINDELTVDEVIWGQNIRRQVQASLDLRETLAGVQPAGSFVGMLRERVDGYGADAAERLKEDSRPRHQRHRLERARGTTLEDPLILEEDIVAAAQGAWRPGAAIPDSLLERASPLGRVKYGTFGEASEQLRRTMGNSAFCFLQQEFDQAFYGMALDLQGLSRSERFDIVSRRLVKHVLLHELGHNVGLHHNFEGSFDALNYYDEFWELHWSSEEQKREGNYEEMRNTSVMEYMARKGVFSDRLGKYDEAAIRFGYAEQVAVFAGDSVDPNLAGGEALREWRYLNDYNEIPLHLCGPAGCPGLPEARSVIRDRAWVHFDPENPPPNEVPFLFCNGAYDRQTPFCATFDYGSNMREIFSYYDSMYRDYYYFTHFQRDRLYLVNWQPWNATRAVEVTFDFVDILSQYFYFLQNTEPRFRGSDLEGDMAAALGFGLNLAAEIVSTPDYRVFVPDARTGSTLYLDCGFSGSCDTDPNSQTGISLGLMRPNLGEARPPGIAFSDEEEFYYVRSMGSYFDKQEVMFRLGRHRSRLLRFNYDLDRRNYFLGLYRLFEPELDDFYRRLFRLDSFFITASTALDLGSFWCQDAQSPGVAALGYFEPRKVIDVQTSETFPGPSANCLSPVPIYPTFFANSPYSAMFFAHSMFSSDFDAQADMGKNLKIWVPGSNDDFAAWANLPSCAAAAPDASCYCPVTNPVTGIEYRGLNLGGPEQSSAACDLVAATDAAVRGFEAVPGDAARFDNMTQWFERLEYSRDLFRVYDRRVAGN